MKRMIVAMDRIIVTTNRQYGGEGDIRILAEDMAVNGLINPITLRDVTEQYKGVPIPGGEYFEIVAGRRRHAAAKLLGWTEIESYALEEGEKEKADAISASENINRLAMHPLDEAEIFRRLIERGETAESLAKRYDRTKAGIWQRVQLLDLSEGIKELFRQGKISLHAAAMLKSLDAQQQDAFCVYFKKTPMSKMWEKSGMSDEDVKEFIAETNGDKLHKCVAGAECQNCKKRTYYSDKELFPELGGNTGDACLDHECYADKWRKLLSSRIRSVKGEHKGHVNTNILVTDSEELKKIFGKSVTLETPGAGGFSMEYSLKLVKYYSNVTADKAEQGALPCLVIGLGGGKLKVTPSYWKEPAKEEQSDGKKQADVFAPIVKMLELPKEEAAQTAAALGKGCSQSWQASDKVRKIEQKVKEKVFGRLLEIKAGQPDSDKDIDRFLTEWLKEGADNRKTARVFAGAEDVKALRKLSILKLFAMLSAGCISFYDMAGIKGIAMAKQDDVAEWAGIPLVQLKEMYKEELRALMPKPKAVKKTDKSKQQAETEAAEDGEDEWEHEKPLGRPVKKRAGIQTCRVCGCTHVTPCVHKMSGDTCWWVEDDLCSACVGKEKPAVKPAKAKKAAPKTAAKKPAAAKAKKAAKKPAAKKQPVRSAKAKTGKSAKTKKAV